WLIESCIIPLDDVLVIREYMCILAVQPISASTATKNVETKDAGEIKLAW
ncbi:10501_t:CDS:1, partial [Racocetra persica]